LFDNLDYLTVNETSNEPPVDDSRDQVNSAAALMREATFINQNFTQQVLVKSKDAKKVSLAQPNPFQSEGQEVAAVGYKYRKWKLNDTISVIARCEVDGVFETKGKDSYLTIKSLNEYDPKQNDWRKKIDAQRGAVLATELRNNAFKIAKWTLQSLLAGTDAIKLGYY
jgi:translation initiation factor 3 subunit D